MDHYEENLQAQADEQRTKSDPRPWIDEDCHQFIQDGETRWLLERNSEAAGFWRIEEYLKWRHAEQDSGSGDRHEKATDHGQ
jgi:hypothetical protein